MRLACWPESYSKPPLASIIIQLSTIPLTPSIYHHPKKLRVIPVPPEKNTFGDREYLIPFLPKYFSCVPAENQMIRFSFGWILTILKKYILKRMKPKMNSLPRSAGEELSDRKDCSPGIWESGDLGGMVTPGPWPELLSRRRLAAAQASANVLMTLLMSIERLEIMCELVNM